jgi:hypothetical protein
MIFDSSLDAIGRKRGTDQASHHHDYLRFYESRFQYLRNEKFTFIEIGVFKGASVAMWGEYFPKATIVGVDYTPECAQYASDRVNIEIGDASNPEFLKSLVKKYGAPTIVIDDGSHRWDHQILALQTFFPMLKPGGHFVLEDIDTSFEAHLKQARFQGESDISAFDYIYKLSRVVVGEAALGSEKAYDDFIAEWAPKVWTIESYRRTVMINRKD